GAWLATNGEAIYSTVPWKQSYQWSKGKLPQKNDKSFMAGYDVAELTKPKQNEAYIEYFFTSKNDNIYCIVPRFTPEIRIRNLKIGQATTATVLGNNKKVTCKQDGNDCVIDLSPEKPGEVPAELFVVKLEKIAN
ncbi:MAG TPA: hypothetical protein VFK47_13625, partial [Ktedonobacteraceae bacterium]|nr:hypothetical protein [Ktedonobacteraceae bacterium]